MTPAAKDFIRSLLRQMDPALAQISDDELSALLLKTTSPSAAPAPLPPSAANNSVIATPRWQDQVIEHTIPDNASVLDLGCGDGQLLAKLIQGKHVRGQGIELDPPAVFECIHRGVPVLQSNLDAGLKGFADRSFDYVILEETLQTLHQPAAVLAEMLRVGRTGIVSFPNFGYWRVRLDLALRGRMPITEMLPYRWYDTPNIHLLTLEDFRTWAEEDHARIVGGHALAESKVRPLQPNDTLYAEEVLLIVQKS